MSAVGREFWLAGAVKPCLAEEVSVRQVKTEALRVHLPVLTSERAQKQ
jgi:hypothetical protein